MMSNNSSGSDLSNDISSLGSEQILSLLTKLFTEWDILQKQQPRSFSDKIHLEGIECQLQSTQTKLANLPTKIRNNEDINVYLDKLSRWRPTIVTFVSPNPPSAILLDRTGTIHSSLTEESSQYKPTSTPPTLSAAHQSFSPPTNQSSDASVASFVAVPAAANNRHVVLPLTKNSHVPPTQHTTTTTAHTVVTVDEDQQVR